VLLWLAECLVWKGLAPAEPFAVVRAPALPKARQSRRSPPARLSWTAPRLRFYIRLQLLSNRGTW